MGDRQSVIRCLECPCWLHKTPVPEKRARRMKRGERRRVDRRTDTGWHKHKHNQSPSQSQSRSQNQNQSPAPVGNYRLVPTTHTRCICD